MVTGRYAPGNEHRPKDLVEWDEVADAVEAIRWDAARHAASLSATEDRWADVRHAPAGSPQAALRALDASTDLAGEALRAEEAARVTEADERARRLMDDLHRATGARDDITGETKAE